VKKSVPVYHSSINYVLALQKWTRIYGGSHVAYLITLIHEGRLCPSVVAHKRSKAALCKHEAQHRHRRAGKPGREGAIGVHCGTKGGAISSFRFGCKDRERRRRKASMKRIPRCTAIHEAAHAIANCRYGFGFHTVHVSHAGTAFVNRRGTRVQNAHGMCEGTLDFSDPLFWAHISQVKRENGSPGLDHLCAPEFIRADARNRAYRYSVDCFAGIAAEVRQSRTSSFAIALSSGRDDYECCKGAAKFVAADERDEHAFIEAAWAEAKRFVRDPAMWQAINALADLLQARGKVESGDADVIAITGIIKRIAELRIP